MKKNSIYLRFNPFSEIVALPFLLNRIFKGQKIKELLNAKIEYARDLASRSKFTDIEKFEKNLEYQNLDNFFANHFKKLDESSYHFFDDKIKYCLKQYLMESRKIWTSTNLVVLEENFLKGAEKTLFLYFILFDNKIEFSEKAVGEVEINLEIEEIEKAKFETKFESKIEKSITLKQIFRNQELFDKIDFSKLKEQNVIYNKDSEDFTPRAREVSDVLIFLSYLSKINLIKLEHGNNYQDIILKILAEISDKDVDRSLISRIYNTVQTDEKKLSKPNLESLNEIKLFIGQYI